LPASVWNETGGGRAVQLPPRALVGFTWRSQACNATHCETISYRIAEVAQDTSTNTMLQHGDNNDVWLYRVEYRQASAHDRWHAACDQGSADGAMGIFVDGQWSEDGAWHPGGWTFSCLNGVIAKCARSWGYKPWKTLRSPVHGDVDLQPLHQACTRAARADYCGSGTSHTRNGTLIDMFDVYGFNVRENVPGFQEESTFDEHGALSVSVPRWPTATPTETGWRFASCERPRQRPAQPATPLIHVWSDPDKGREIPGKMRTLAM
jgi:ADYC domain